MELGVGILTDLRMRDAGRGDGRWPNAWRYFQQTVSAQILLSLAGHSGFVGQQKVADRLRVLPHQLLNVAGGLVQTPFGNGHVERRKHIPHEFLRAVPDHCGHRGVTGDRDIRGFLAGNLGQDRGDVGSTDGFGPRGGIISPRCWNLSDHLMKRKLVSRSQLPGKPSGNSPFSAT